MSSWHRIRAAWGSAILVATALLWGGCGGGDDPIDVEPDPAIAPFVGNWTALAMVVTSVANPDVSPDLIEEGATFSLNVQASGQYTANLIFLQQVSTEIGFISVSGSTVTLKREFPSPSTSTATYEFQGSLLTLDGPTEFDFNLDGEPEAAEGHIELQRS
ncbi:MAG: hypothetical protein P8170_03140 [Gemmatimonadota bacterium]|jgi:hypothetical protein